jgi:hypothetical protein
MPTRALLLSLALAASTFTSIPAVAQQTAPAIESITREDLASDLYFLAGDEMRGRLAGSAENRLASAFIKSRFERLGLKPVGTDGYYQYFNVARLSVGAKNQLAISFDQGVSLTRERGQDFYPLRESDSGIAAAPVVFAGFGITAYSLGYDDFAGDVAGKIVLILDHEPGEEDPDSPFDGLVTSEHSRDYRKLAAAQAAGAVGVMVVTDVHNHEDEANFTEDAQSYWPEVVREGGRYTLASRLDRIRIPAVRISVELAEGIVEGTGRSLADLSRGAETEAGFTPLALPGVEVKMVTDVRRELYTARNVVGLVEGSDPELRDEWIMITAHFDHDGAENDMIFNGADDNGSGTVGVIEIAEAYAQAVQRGEGPRRSVLLAAWNFEEKGLLGAWAYAENPLHPLEQTLATLNMDMIGRNEEVPQGGGNRFRGLDVQTAESNANAVNIMGTTRSDDLRLEVQQANSDIGLDLRLRYDNHPLQLLRRSDQWPLMQVGVPALFYHTGLHPDYHREGDRPERINYEKLEKVVRLVYQTSWSLATRSTRPVT